MATIIKLLFINFLNLTNLFIILLKSYSLLILCFCLFISGCGFNKQPINFAHEKTHLTLDHSLPLSAKIVSSNDGLVILAFSGGGTRAAAFSYGVLSQLKDTPYNGAKENNNFLHEVDLITSVSGGSFTSAYYGLYGDKIFTDFESTFLRKPVQSILVKSLLNPLNWFRLTSDLFTRTDIATKYYDERIFSNATFSDLRKDGPAIQINATELTTGLQFSFTNNMFSLLCADINKTKISHAVTASSAVPVLFPPVVLENFDHCSVEHPLYAFYNHEKSNDVRLKKLYEGLKTIENKKSVPYVHLVDGGISDNLGVRSIYNAVLVRGGIKNTLAAFNIPKPRYIAVIIVNAATNPKNDISQSKLNPGSSKVVSAISKAQLHNYNTESIALMDQTLKQWSNELSTDDNYVPSFLVQVEFNQLKDEKKLQFLNNIATSFELQNKQVDRLIDTAKMLLKNSNKFQQLQQYINSIGEIEN